MGTVLPCSWWECSTMDSAEKYWFPAQSRYLVGKPLDFPVPGRELTTLPGRDLPFIRWECSTISLLQMKSVETRVSRQKRELDITANSSMNIIPDTFGGWRFSIQVLGQRSEFELLGKCLLANITINISVHAQFSLEWVEKSYELHWS